MLDSKQSESPRKADENIDKRLSADKSDRLLRRITKYRVHQSDCEMKNELGFRDLCLHESDLVRKLQQQKAVGGKQKRVTKTRKRKTEERAPLHNSSEPQNDFSDLNYSEMLALMNSEPSRLPDQQPQNIILCSCTPNSLHNVYDHIQPNFASPYF